MSWKRLAIVLALLGAFQQYRWCTRRALRPEAVDCPKVDASRTLTPSDGFTGGDDATARAAQKPALTGTTFHAYGFGVTVPPWAMFFVPHAGEDMRSYRDRMLPIAQKAIAPQRARVARSRDELAQVIHMDAHQRAELDGATGETASALENRVMGAVANGDFDPATFKAMTGVTLAKGLIDDVERGNQRWQASLSDEQRAKLAQHPFDFADYLVFSTPWEDLLKFLD